MAGRQQPIELFMPPNMLKAKVGGGLGGIDMAAMKRADGALDTLKSHFADWIASDVKTLMEARARYAKTPDAPARSTRCANCWRNPAEDGPVAMSTSSTPRARAMPGRSTASGSWRPGVKKWKNVTPSSPVASAS